MKNENKIGCGPEQTKIGARLCVDFQMDITTLIGGRPSIVIERTMSTFV